MYLQRCIIFHFPSITNTDVIWIDQHHEVSTTESKTNSMMLLLDLIVFLRQHIRSTSHHHPFLKRIFLCLKFNFWNTFKYTNANPPCLFSKSIHYTHLHISYTDLFQSLTEIGKESCHHRRCYNTTSRNELDTHLPDESLIFGFFKILGNRNKLTWCFKVKNTSTLNFIKWICMKQKV